jgi:glycerophosphoryl diester phosphodiesterase
MVFICIAHRGLSASAPENTVAAFHKAIALGFDNIETDCQLSADKVCFIVHDEQLGRVNDGSGAVAAASASYIATLDAGSWFDPVYQGQRIPRLEDMLLQYKGKIHLHLVSGMSRPSHTAPPITTHGLIYS